MKPTYNIPELLHAALSTPSLSQSVRFFLDWSPEIKHEGLVCTHLSALLQSQGTPARREVSMQRRRIDIAIGDSTIEAKYHFEGDLLAIKSRLAGGAIYDPKGWNSAPNSILAELTRGKASYFLWHICVRSQKLDKPYRYPELIDQFYRHVGATNIQEAIARTTVFVDELLPLLKRYAPQIESFSMPRIEGEHSSLVTKLYYFPIRNDT